MQKKTMAEVFIIRHARAGGNRSHILNGRRRDVGLTSKGVKDAKALAASWNEKPDVIVSSPMKRARRTAYYLAKKYNMKIEYLDLLAEHDLGDWTGHSALKLRSEFPSYFFDYENGQKSHFLKKVPGGENWAQITKRAKKALAVIGKKYAGKKVAAFAHGILAIAMINEVAKIEPPKLWAYRLRNCEWVKFVL
ncbi:MAG: histidine phosphatase family protein [Candidatus Micrarchaeia archaeon]